MPSNEFVRSMKAGVRLIEVVFKANQRGIFRYAVTTLRHGRRVTFDNLNDAETAFGEEVLASRDDPRVGPYVRGPRSSQSGA